MNSSTKLAALPVAPLWFTVARISDDIALITEPFVHPFVRANIWHVRGSTRDLVVDSGLGVGSLRANVPDLFLRDPLLVITHAHLDHIGSAGEFADRRWHLSERDHGPVKATLHGPELGSLLGIPPGSMPELLIDAVPYAGFDLDTYEYSGAEPTRGLTEGDMLEIGGRELAVLHCPGHTPGSIVLYEASRKELFSGDVLYDGALLDQLKESDRAAYRSTLERIRALDIDVVYPGHGDTFDGHRSRELIDRYLQ